MNTATITLWIIALVLGAYALSRRDDSLRRGIVMAWSTFKRNAILLLIAFVIVGYVNVLSPTKLVETWIGPQSGLKGLFLAEIIGMLLPGGPYVVFPLIAVLYSAGAGLGPAVTLVTSWATLALLSITFELPFMGWRFTAVRWGLGLLVPVLAGAVAQLFV